MKLSDEVLAELRAQIEDAESYIDGEVGPDRALATEYFHAEPLGNEEEGRSQVVLPEVRNTVIGLMPDLIAAFLGPENIVEYAPRSQEDAEMAEQATDFANRNVLERDNNGFKVLHDAFQDALVRKTGILKWYWDETEKSETIPMTGLSPLELEAVAELGEVEVTEEYVRQDETGEPFIFSDIELTRTEKDGKVRVECLPPEEFLISRDAKDLQTARYIGHRTYKSIDELVEMGYSRSVVERYAGPTTELEGNREAQARSIYQNSPTSEMRPDSVKCVESYFKVKGERRRILTIGDSCHELENDPAPNIDFALLCPCPEAHSAIGFSTADQVGDIQRINSALIRNILDSAAQSIHPRTVLTDLVNIDDAMSTEIGAPIRVRGSDAVNSIRELAKPFIGQELLPMLDVMAREKEDRTGVSRASAGLDPDALQSSTRKAVEATISGRERQSKMLAMIFANQLLPLYKGILRLLVENQDKPRTVRLRNRWVTVSPDSWNADMDVEINQGVSGGTLQDRIAILQAVAADQDRILETYGLENPVVGLQEWHYTRSKLLEMNGIKTSAKFYKDIDPNWVPPKPEPGQGDPLLQAQMKAIEAEVAIKQMEAEQKAIKDRASDDRERDRNEMDFWLKAREMEFKYGVKLQEAEIRAQVERQRQPVN